MNLSLVPVFAASAKLGAVYAAVDPELDPDTLLDVLQIARPSLVVIDDERASSSRELATELGVPAIGLGRLVRSSAGDDDRELPVAGPNELDPQALFFPATATGRPKGALLSHRVQYLRSQRGALPGRRGAAVCPYPLSHFTAWELALRQWQARSRVALVDAGDPAALCDAVSTHRATHLTAPPSLLREVLALAASDGEHRRRQLGSLREVNLVVPGRAPPAPRRDRRHCARGESAHRPRLCGGGRPRLPGRRRPLSQTGELWSSNPLRRAHRRAHR